MLANTSPEVVESGPDLARTRISRPEFDQFEPFPRVPGMKRRESADTELCSAKSGPILAMLAKVGPIGPNVGATPLLGGCSRRSTSPDFLVGLLAGSETDGLLGRRIGDGGNRRRSIIQKQCS